MIDFHRETVSITYVQPCTIVRMRKHMCSVTDTKKYNILKEVHQDGSEIAQTD